MMKSEVYSWRLEPELKEALQDAARTKGVSMSELLGRIAREFLARQDAGEDGTQRALQDAAAATFGSIHGGNAERSERAGETVRARLRQRSDARA